MGNKGLEPLHLTVLEPKSSASANSANSPGGVPHEFYYTLDSGAVLESAPAYIWLPEKRCTKTSERGNPHNNKRLTAGCPGGVRTHDIQINSLALYRLSYRAIFSCHFGMGIPRLHESMARPGYFSFASAAVLLVPPKVYEILPYLIGFAPPGTRNRTSSRRDSNSRRPIGTPRALCVFDITHM